MVAYGFDVNKSGEAATRPDLRTTPIREKEYTKIVKGVLAARHSTAENQVPTLGTGEVGLLLDGGKHGNAAKLLAPWREGTLKGKKSKEDVDDAEDENVADDDEDEDSSLPGFVPTQLQLVITEASLAARRKFLRGTATIKQTHTCHIVSHKKICLPERPRQNYDGSSAGDVISGITLPSLAKDSGEWFLTVADKKRLYGKKNLIPVGGKVGGEDANPIDKRTDDKLEPVTWLSLPEKLLEEFLWLFFVKLFFDLTPADAKMAWVCCKKRCAYVGIAFNQDHIDFMEKRLFELYKAEMCVEGGPLYNIQFAKLMATGDGKKDGKKDVKKDGKKEGKKDDKTDGKKKGKKDGQKAAPKKRKGKAKAGGKAKKPKKAEEPEEGDEDEDLDEDDEEEEDDEGSGGEDATDDEEELWDPLKAA